LAAGGFGQQAASPASEGEGFGQPAQPAFGAATTGTGGSPLICVRRKLIALLRLPAWSVCLQTRALVLRSSRAPICRIRRFWCTGCRSIRLYGDGLGRTQDMGWRGCVWCHVRPGLRPFRELHVPCGAYTDPKDTQRGCQGSVTSVLAHLGPE
jgi:hypothetical protein